MYARSGSGILTGEGTKSLGLGLSLASLLSLSLSDLLRLRRVKGFGLPFFDELGRSYSVVDDASDSSDLEGRIEVVLWLGCS